MARNTIAGNGSTKERKAAVARAKKAEGLSKTEMAEIIDEECVRLAGAAAIVNLAMDSIETEADALGIALDTIEAANTELAKLAGQARR